MPRPDRLCATLALMLAAADPAAAEIHACDDPMLSVDARSDALAAQVCDAATEAKALLLSCGVAQTDPIHISVVDHAMHPSFGECLAVFDQRTGCLQVTDIANLPSHLPANDARTALPPEVLFAATITHEMTHALLQQAAGEVQVAATEQEFVANAMEMQSLDPAWRDKLLEAWPVAPGGALSLVHLSI